MNVVFDAKTDVFPIQCDLDLNGSCLIYIYIVSIRRIIVPSFMKIPCLALHIYAPDTKYD